MDYLRTPLQRVGAMVLLAVGFGYAIAAGYWLSENSLPWTVVNLFWFALFTAAAMVMDGPQGIRARLWALGWRYLLGLLFALIALCDVFAAIYWLTQRSIAWVCLNLVGVAFFGLLAAFFFLISAKRSREDSQTN